MGQAMNLLLLALSIQGAILVGELLASERSLRRSVRKPGRERQAAAGSLRGNRRAPERGRWPHPKRSIQSRREHSFCRNRPSKFPYNAGRPNVCRETQAPIVPRDDR